MARAEISHWKPAFDGLGVDPDETSAPDDSTGQWFEGLAKFSRHSFARLLFCPDDTALHLRLEVALGPPEEHAEALSRQLVDHLSATTETDWEASSLEETPWVIESSLSGAEDGDVDTLRRLLLDLLEVAEHFDRVDTAEAWFDILGDDRDESESTSSEASTTDETGDTPFESIGDGSSETPSSDDDDGADGATVESAAATRIDDTVRIAIGFRQVLAPRQIDALEEGLEHHLRTKFDVRVESVDGDDRAELRRPSSARTVIRLAVEPDRFSGSMTDLEKELDSFLRRLEKFSSFGVDLFEYLGVGETVFDGGETSPATTADDGERELSFQRRAPSDPERRRPSPEVDDDEVVLEIAADTATSAQLEAGNYTDPRLRRDDAETALVDVVLRHPGYAEGRMGQVLSILLSIEYHDAIDLADSAPCVIAWGVGRRRAKRFKDVIEGAGGKVVLVEPGTFGEG